MYPVVFLALIATIGTWSVTALGAATVVFLKYPQNRLVYMIVGFCYGVFFCASFW